MNRLKTISGINLIVFLTYSIILLIINSLHRHFDSFYSLVVIVTIHSIVNLFIATYFFIEKQGTKAKSFLMSFLVIVGIGFSSCKIAYIPPHPTRTNNQITNTDQIKTSDKIENKKEIDSLKIQK
jgi:hypothetical protein